jgi:hypothetical protein
MTSAARRSASSWRPVRWDAKSRSGAEGRSLTTEKGRRPPSPRTPPFRPKEARLLYEVPLYEVPAVSSSRCRGASRFVARARYRVAVHFGGVLTHCKEVTYRSL